MQLAPASTTRELKVLNCSHPSFAGNRNLLKPGGDPAELAERCQEDGDRDREGS